MFKSSECTSYQQGDSGFAVNFLQQSIKEFFESQSQQLMKLSAWLFSFHSFALVRDSYLYEDLPYFETKSSETKSERLTISKGDQTFYGIDDLIS